MQEVFALKRTHPFLYIGKRCCIYKEFFKTTTAANTGIPSLYIPCDRAASTLHAMPCRNLHTQAYNIGSIRWHHQVQLCNSKQRPPHWSVAGPMTSVNGLDRLPIRSLYRQRVALTCSPWPGSKSSLRTAEVTGSSSSCEDTSDLLQLTLGMKLVYF